jgi:hypothetical protein
MTDSQILPGLDPDVLRRVVTVEASTEQIEKMKHRADVRQFTFYSDEPPSLGGDEQHPFPLDYFTAAIGL